MRILSWIVLATLAGFACSGGGDAPASSGSSGSSSQGEGGDTTGVAVSKHLGGSSGSTGVQDAGSDTSVDAGVDASADAGVDASADASVDGASTGLDGGTEVGLDASAGGLAGAAGSSSSTAAKDAAADTGGPIDTGIPEASFVYDPPEVSVDACTEVSAQATVVMQPIDILFIIDNSSSMAGEIEQVQARINEDFADIIGASGIDYRVIMVSRYGQVGVDVHGSDNPICIDGALGGDSACVDPENTQAQHNPPRFYHYSADIESEDAWCKLLEGYGATDELQNDNLDTNPRPFTWAPIAPTGWSQFLRADAFKVFTVITDDNVNCSDYGYSFFDGALGDDNVSQGEQAAADFDAALLALAPLQFGTVEQRSYVWHSIVGMVAYTDPTEAWPPTEPIQTEICPQGAESPATGYQALSILTGGLRYPSCRNDDFNAIFNAIALGVIEKAAVPCEFEVPPPDQGIIDPSVVKVEYTPGNGGSTQRYDRVADAAACAASQGFYFDPEPTRIVLCPSTCDTVQADATAQVSVNLGCLGS